jgi:deoxycytidylate deaminase
MVLRTRPHGRAGMVHRSRHSHGRLASTRVPSECVARPWTLGAALFVWILAIGTPCRMFPASSKVSQTSDDALQMNAERKKQIERDRYYMAVADAVQLGADCTGTQVGALLVLDNRIIGTGYNGTPSGFTNCRDRGCVRCYDSFLFREGRQDEMSDPAHISGQALDRCICVHAEQNAIVTAARFGIEVQRATLYTTQSPCFGCLKESLQAGLNRLVFKNVYAAKYSRALTQQYGEMVRLLTDGDETRFEALGGGPAPHQQGQPDPYEDSDSNDGVPIDSHGAV